jgi:putative tryptophan/tyrosine transport system substrate-binding protein
MKIVSNQQSLVKSAYVAFCAMLFALYATAEAQQARVPKIGVLSGSSRSTSGGSRLELIRQGLHELGYVEGKNITIVYRSAEQKFERLPALVDELIGLKVDVLVMSSTPSALAAKKATSTIPIVFIGVSDPVAAGLVDSLPRPGGNVTGFTAMTSELAGKRLELLKETVPKLSRVAVLWDPRDPNAAGSWKESQIPARELNLQLHSMEVSSSDRYENAYKEAIKAGSAAVAVAGSAVAVSNRKQIADLAARNQLPAIYHRGDFVDGGGLMSYGANQIEPYRRVAVYVDKILNGAKPADLPVEQPIKFEFVINLKTAKQIGLTIPPNVLVRANKVIK